MGDGIAPAYSVANAAGSDNGLSQGTERRRGRIRSNVFMWILVCLNQQC